MELKIEIAPRMELQASPGVIAFAEMLALPGLQLERRIEVELAGNPALERLEPLACAACGEALLRSGSCWRCDGSALARGLRESAAPDIGPDRLMLIPDRLTPAERLLRDVRLVLPIHDRVVAERVVQLLDARGLLDCDPQDLASSLGVRRQVVDRIVAAMREVGPPDLGARDIQEALLLQLRALPGGHPLAEEIILRHLEALAQGRWPAIAADLGVDEAEVRAARDFIRQRLRPQAPFDVLESDHWEQRHAAAPSALPDVAITEQEDGTCSYQVEVLEAGRLSVRIDAAYRQAARAWVVPGAQGRLALCSEGERQHVERFVRRGEAFLQRLRERWETMRRVTEAVAERQAGFLHEGPPALQPLTRRDVARMVGLHESTVSRAVADRNVLLPSGRVIPFCAFFDAATSAREALREILAAEERPLSDAELSRRLRMRGYRVARRTVCKYRRRLRVPPGAVR